MFLIALYILTIQAKELLRMQELTVKIRKNLEDNMSIIKMEVERFLECENMEDLMAMKNPIEEVYTMLEILHEKINDEGLSSYTGCISLYYDTEWQIRVISQYRKTEALFKNIIYKLEVQENTKIDDTTTKQRSSTKHIPENSFSFEEQNEILESNIEKEIPTKEDNLNDISKERVKMLIISHDLKEFILEMFDDVAEMIELAQCIQYFGILDILVDINTCFTIYSNIKALCLNYAPFIDKTVASIRNRISGL